MFDNIKQSTAKFFSGDPSKRSKQNIYSASMGAASNKEDDRRDQLKLGKHYYQRAVKARTAVNKVGRAVGTVGVGGGLLYAGAKGIKNAITKAPTLESQILEMQLNIFKYNRLKGFQYD